MKKRSLFVSGLLSILLVAIIAGPAASVVFVATTGLDTNDGLTWGTAKRTIQAGINLANTLALDRTVWVARSTVLVPQYVENVAVLSGILVYGGFAGTEDPATFDLSTRDFVTNETIIQPLVVATPSVTTNGANRVDGFTIQGGSAANGAGVFCTANTSSIVANCVIKNHTSSGLGAGIYGTATTGSGNTLTVNSCTFQNNTASSGGGIYVSGMNLLVDPTTFQNQTAVLGAGVFAQNAIVSLTDCTFIDNLAQDTALLSNPAGGGVYTSNCALSVLRCTFTRQIARVRFNNATSAKGGGIYASGGSVCSIGTCQFNNCLATGDTVATYTSWGGAAYISGVNAVVRNNFIYLCGALGAGSTQPAYGGAIAYINQGTLNLINNTFYLNQVTPNAGLVTDIDRPYGNGAAIFTMGAGNTANIINNIITKCRGTAVVNQGMQVNLNYNVLWHNAGGDIFGFSFPVYSTNPALNKDFNIMKDPNLRDPDTGDLHILYGSPARDTGRNTGAPSTDIDGELRPNWSGVVGPPPAIAIVDIGADEFVDTSVPHDGGANNDPRGPATTDPDADLIFNPFDNCPTTPNTDQVDSNGDQMGDACTPLATGPTPLVYYVDGLVASSGNGLSWATAFKTIQEGIDAADSHNQAGWTQNYEVWVRGGGVVGGQTYVENPMIWHGVAVYGAWAGTELPTDLPDPHPLRDYNANQTSIDGSAINPSVTMAHLPQDRYLTDPPKTAYDATITVLDTFRPINGKGELGGGVSIYKDLTNVSTCRIQSNAAALGGGVYMYKSNGMLGDGLNPPLATLTTNSTQVFYNTASGVATYAGYGGGIYTERGTPTIFANLIEGNTAFFGGAIASRASSPNIIGNLIGCESIGPPSRVNTALGDGTGNGQGGGIYMDSGSDVGMDKNTIVSNQATGATGQGGGLYVDSSNFTMKNTIVANNIATDAVPAQAGGAIFATGTSPAIVDPWCYIRYCDFWNNTVTQFVGIPDPTTAPPPTSCGQTNLAVDPLFVSAATCNYALQAGSPLRGAGDPADGSPNIGAFQDEDPPVSISGAKDLGNGVIAEISGAVVTATFPEGFYIESTDRTAGIFVRKYGAPVHVGQLVDVTGTVSTSGIEREIVDPTITVSYAAAPEIQPLAMGNRQVGGGPSGRYCPGVTKGIGPSNLGLLIQTWGAVKRIETSPRKCYFIDDGSKVGVKVFPPSTATLPAVGTMVTVTGISCVDYTGKSYGRMIRTRESSVMCYPPR